MVYSRSRLDKCITVVRVLLPSITGTFTEYIVADNLFFRCEKKFNEKLWHLKIQWWTERERGREIIGIAICKLNFMIFKVF
jgi:hypothetical protein